MPPSYPPHPAEPALVPTPQLACTSSRTAAPCAPQSCLLQSCLLQCGTCTSMACACTVRMAMELHSGHWTQQQCWSLMLHHLAQCAPCVGHWGLGHWAPQHRLNSMMILAVWLPPPWLRWSSMLHHLAQCAPMTTLPVWLPPWLFSWPPTCIWEEA